MPDSTQINLLAPVTIGCYISGVLGILMNCLLLYHLQSSHRNNKSFSILLTINCIFETIFSIEYLITNGVSLESSSTLNLQIQAFLRNGTNYLICFLGPVLLFSPTVRYIHAWFFSWFSVIVITNVVILYVDQYLTIIK